MLFSRLNQRKLLGLATIGIVLLTVITFVHAADVDPPIWQNQGQSVSSLVVGGSNLLYAQGKDETSLRKAVLSTNETGTWTNYTGDVGGWVNAEGWILVDRFNRPDSGSIGNAEYPQTAWNTSGGTISISSNSLKIVGGGAGVTAKATQSYSASDTYTVEGNASFAQISDWPAIALDYGTTSNRLGFSARSDGYVYYLASLGWVKSTKAYSANAWYNCRITVYPSTHKADYYFDGTLLGANVSYYQSAVTDPNVLRISQYNSAATLYADEIFAYEGQTKPAQYPSRSLYGSPMDLGDVANTWVWSNFTWHNPSIAGGTSVAWRIYYEDASSNMKATDIITFSVTADTNPPQWRSQGESKSTLYAGESVGLYAQGFDDSGLYRAILSTNETGYWVNYTGAPFEVISGLTWTDYSGNPILPLGAPGEWDSAETGGPDVVMVNDTYYMYYAGHNGSAWSMGLAFSDDGVSWTKYENNPILTGTPGQWDSGSLWVPNVIRFNETHFIWVYGAGGRIGVAWSTDGINWTKDPHNPVIGPTAGWYDSSISEGGHTILVDGTLYLYIIGYASDGTGARGGLATSTDGMHWTKIPGPFTYNSILDIGPPGSVDDVEVEPEMPLVSDGVWYLCYSYRSTSAYWKCGLAISNDGVNFVKDVNNPLKGQGWTGGWAKRTHINIKSKDGSTRYMYYNSNGQTGMAMAPVTMSMRQTYGSPMDMGNVSGSWVWSNFTWQNVSTPVGTTVAWRIYYEDASGNWNGTNLMAFHVTSDTTLPQWRNQGESRSIIEEGASVGLYAQGFDDSGLYGAVLSTNETGYWVNYTGAPFEVISGLTWTDYSGNPILPLGAPGEWDSAETGGPDVVMVNDTYYMYYAGHNGSAWSMGLAFSDDGISWTKYENNPVLTGTSGEWDQGTLWVPNVIRFNETHFIWVYGATSAGIGVAWSTDGIHWSKYANNPVITPTPGWYDSAEAEGGHTILVNGTLYLYIIGYASDGTGARGGLATSTDGIHWTKIPGPFTYNSILDIGPPGSVDDVEVEPEEPLILDGTWYLCYSYRSTSAYWKCGLAISDDGVNFVKDPNNPLKGQGWTGGWAKRTHINIKSKDGSTRYMYYNSNGQTGMAMAPVTMSMRQTYGSPMDMGNVSGSWVWSNYTWQNASVVDGTTVAWRIYYEDTSGNWNATDIMTFQIGVKPTLNIIPTTKTCRMYNETFTVNIDVTTESNITDFEFELDFNTTLLDYSNINWNAWGAGTVTVDEIGGKLTGHTWGSMISGSQTLVSLKFNATLHHIWKNLPGWANDQNGKIFIQAANLSYPGPVKLRYERGGSNEINVGPDSTYTFSPIQGDVDNSGLVDIFDLRTVAAYYDQGNATYNLTGDSIIDIFDLVIIGVNYNYKYNP